MRETGLERQTQRAEMLNEVFQLSICPPAAVEEAEEIATTVAGIGYRGIYVEANAISPTRMHRIAPRFTIAGIEPGSLS
ncbi:MAG: hypothetical protein ACRDTT_15445 [Pseudonocardiaceae bacterium]